MSLVPAVKKPGRQPGIPEYEQSHDVQQHERHRNLGCVLVLPSPELAREAEVSIAKLHAARRQRIEFRYNLAANPTEPPRLSYNVILEDKDVRRAIVGAQGQRVSVIHDA